MRFCVCVCLNIKKTEGKFPFVHPVIFRLSSDIKSYVEIDKEIREYWVCYLRLLVNSRCKTTLIDPSLPWNHSPAPIDIHGCISLLASDQGVSIYTIMTMVKPRGSEAVVEKSQEPS